MTVSDHRATEWELTPPGKRLDLSFIGRPHEHDPRRVYSTTATDWQARVDFDRLRRDRLARARMMMERHDLSALVCFVGENVRYITGVFQGNWKNNIFIRYCVLPRDGDPVLFETAGSDLECAKIDAPWLNGNIRPAITWRWAETAEQMMSQKMADSVLDVLREAGVEQERIGIDIYDPSAGGAFQNLGLNIVSAWPAMSGARVVKTPDELECLKISSAIGDTSFWRIEHEWLRPGIKEATITAKVNEYLYEHGFDFVYDIIVASGGNTSPYRRWHTDKVIREGDLVIVDQNAVGPGGYFVDFVRCFNVGGRWTPKQKDLYKETYDSMYAAIEQLKAGNTTADVAAMFPEYADDEYGTVTLQQFAHSIGLSLYEGMWVSRAYSLDYPVELEENMYFACETFAGHPGLEQTVRLEENVLVTKDGPVLFTRHPHPEFIEVPDWARQPKVARVLVTDHAFPDLEPERRVLEPLGVELVLAEDAEEATLAGAARGADALLVCYAQITPEVIAAAEPSCRVIARYGVGYDNIDIDAASKAGILVTYVPDYCLDEVADHAMSLLLAAARAVVFAARDVEAGRWALPEAPVHRLRGRRLALVGVGRIGQRVAERARSFGLEVVGFDPFLRDWDGIGVERADTLEEALVDADAISLHAPLTPENRHLISDRTLTGLNRRPTLVNTSRGGLVDLDAAVRALDDGRLSAVALDVTEPEPLPADHRLRRHPRAIVTPHMAYYSVEAQQDLQTRAADEVARALRGEPPRCPVNADVIAAPSR